MPLLRGKLSSAARALRHGVRHCRHGFSNLTDATAGRSLLRWQCPQLRRERKTDMSESLNTPTVVLVHGGFADASYWVPVIKDLQAHDLPVLAPPNPLRGLAHAHLRPAPPTCRPRPSCCCSWRP